MPHQIPVHHKQIPSITYLQSGARDAPTVGNQLQAICTCQTQPSSTTKKVALPSWAGVHFQIKTCAYHMLGSFVLGRSLGEWELFGKKVDRKRSIGNLE
ncbi:hypothetical protein PoMZ_03577 [Pyricularia oryzae]|uniref:Uncharacterized protein n=1 Tax=Pyricularia oryzae TaxID=318829 RepID=A0A4P7NB38_PYROR|nr:hypothetical protein PoMZ_03577 [Pyricularia oryzae]